LFGEKTKVVSEKKFLFIESFSAFQQDLKKGQTRYYRNSSRNGGCLCWPW